MEAESISQQRRLRLLATFLSLAVLVQGFSSCSSKPTSQPQQSAGSPQPAQTPANQQADSADQPAVKIPADQLDSLVAPIAMYPDPLLSQVLVASTYPLELIQLQQWLEKNPNLKDKALVDSVSKQPWDPSIQAMAPLPEVVKRLADDLQWTTDLGNAFLAQQSDVMDAIQRMRQKAQGTGALKSNEQVRVETKVVENKTVIIVEQANPEVIYVPVYDPVYVYGAPVYPYPAIYYPTYSTGAVVAATAISFGVGVAMGAAWGGGWGWGCGWGDNDIDINVNNNFNRNVNISGGNRVNNISGGNRWQHNPQHRGGAPYPNRATADRFGGTARGDSLQNRQRAAGRELNRERGNLGSADRAAGDRGGVGSRDGAGDRAGARDRSGAASRDRSRAGERDRGDARASDRSRSASDRSRSAGNRGGGSSGDRVGSRNAGSSGNRSGFGDSSGYSGSRARESSNRGASSMGGSRGGGGGSSRSGFSGGGGGGRGGGGGGRGGGGRR